jgi:hypothetical protein
MIKLLFIRFFDVCYGWRLVIILDVFSAAFLCVISIGLICNCIHFVWYNFKFTYSHHSSNVQYIKYFIENIYPSFLSSVWYSCLLFWKSRFKYQPGDRLYWQIFVVFISISRQVLAWYLKLGHDHSLPNPLQFMIDFSPYHSTVHNLS